MESEMDKVRGGEAVDGDDGEWMRRRWRRTTSHVDRQYTHEMLTRCAKADPRSEIRRCGSRGSFPRSAHTPSLQKSEGKVNMEDEVEGKGTVFGSSSSRIESLLHPTHPLETQNLKWPMRFQQCSPAKPKAPCPYLSCLSVISYTYNPAPRVLFPCVCVSRWPIRSLFHARHRCYSRASLLTVHCALGQDSTIEHVQNPDEGNFERDAPRVAAVTQIRPHGTYLFPCHW